MSRILLVLNRASRELSLMSAIRANIIKLDPESRVEIVPFDGNFMSAAAAFESDVVLIFPMGSVGVSRLMYLLKLRFGCRIVCLRAEGILDPQSLQSVTNHVGFDSYGSRLIDAELFWGPGAADLIGGELLRQGKISSPDRIKCFGYPRLERYFSSSAGQDTTALPKEITSRMAKHERSRTVLVATGFHFANYTAASLFRAGDLDAKNRFDDLMGLVSKVQNFRQEWIEAVRASASRHPDILFVVKKHPNESKEDYAALEGSPNILYVAEDVDFGDILQHVGLLVHYGSTAAADAYLSGIPTVYAFSRDPALQDWFPHMRWPSAYSIPINDLEGVIEKFAGGEAWPDNSDQIREVLEWNFNIRPGVEYKPSRDIAAFLLADERPQRIPVWDQYLCRALFWYVGVKVRQFGSTLFGKGRQLLRVN